MNSREEFESMDFFEQQGYLIDELSFRLIERLKSSKTSNEEFIGIAEEAIKLIKFIQREK